MKRILTSILTFILLILVLFSNVLPTQKNVIVSASQNTGPTTLEDNDGNMLDPISKGGYTITKKITTKKTQRFDIILPKKVYMPDTLIDDINAIMDAIEKQTGLSFYPKNSKLDKVQIEVKLATNAKESEFGYAYGGVNGAVISPGDILLGDKGNNFVLTHELLHCIQFRNHGSLGQICDEGFTTYNTEQILESMASPYLLNSHSNYQYMEQELTKSNIAKLFSSDAIGWDGYLIGFRFMHYLEEKLGKGTYLKILKKAYKTRSDIALPLSDVNTAIKSVTSKTVFTDFVKWHSDQEDMFKNIDFTFHYTNCKKLNLYPSFAAWNFYQTLKFTYKNKFTIDFTNGFEYLQTYKGYDVNGFNGVIGSKGTATFKFYDINGTLILSKPIENTTETIEVIGAVKIIVSGDGDFATINPNFDLMVVKEK